jgi:predicted type IV restriction endonuclease
MPIPVWEQKSRDAVKAFLKKNIKMISALEARDAVEADTRTFVTEMLVEGLGFDKYDELTAEYLVRGEFADIGIRIDKKIEAFVEIKRVTTPLKDLHLRQVKTYAANEGVEWVVLTNGRVWQVYHISTTTPIEHTLLLEVDIVESGATAKSVDALWQISREALKRQVLVSAWKTESALTPANLAAAILAAPVIAAVRKELRVKTGNLVDVSKVTRAVTALFEAKR